MVETNIRIYRPDISEKLEELIEQGMDFMDPHTTYHIKGDVIWALDPKAKNEIMRGQWGRGTKRHQPTRIVETIQKDLSNNKECIP